jgi:hypothetical protein
MTLFCTGNRSIMKYAKRRLDDSIAPVAGAACGHSVPQCDDLGGRRHAAQHGVPGPRAAGPVANDSDAAK